MMCNDVLGQDRLIGIIQPSDSQLKTETITDDKLLKIRDIGCVGRITSFTEMEDERLMISLSGVSRFVISHEEFSELPYRLFNVNFKPFVKDLKPDPYEDEIDRTHLLDVLKEYLESHDLSADWESIDRASNELLVNTLSTISPYGPEEKQALLEAPDLKARSEVLIALAEMEMAARDDGSGTSLQ